MSRWDDFKEAFPKLVRWHREVKAEVDQTDRSLLQKGTCPSCKTPDAMLLGPRGGAARNVACSICGQEFNVLIHDGNVVAIVQRMGKASSDRLRTVYGLSMSTASH